VNPIVLSLSKGLVETAGFIASQSVPESKKALHMDFKPLVTLLAIVNPLAIVPFFIHYTQGFTRAQRQRTIVVASFTAFLVIAVSALLGLQILSFFSISLASFQVGGGMLLLTSSLNMLNAQPAEAKPHTHEMEEGAEKAAMGASIAVVPLTIPLLTGPATMSTVVIYTEKAKTYFQLGTLVAYGLVIGLATALCFSLAEPIARVLGKTGINVMTRLMGLILAALAVEVMADGLGKLFPTLRG
jgi:multiple antibiotic resistance protein